MGLLSGQLTHMAMPRTPEERERVEKWGFVLVEPNTPVEGEGLYRIPEARPMSEVVGQPPEGMREASQAVGGSPGKSTAAASTPTAGWRRSWSRSTASTGSWGSTAGYSGQRSSKRGRVVTPRGRTGAIC